MPTTPGAVLLATAEASDPRAVLDAAAGWLRSWVGAGPLFLASADPVTGSFATTVAVDIDAEASARFLAIELSGADVVRFADLATAAAPIGSLHAATGGRPRDSVRWREVIEPLGWGDELRAAVVADGAVWGYLCLHREAADRAFTAVDAARLGRLLPVLAAALRRSARGTGERPPRLGSGVVIVDGTGRLTGLSGAAAEWLDECGPTLPGGLPLPVAALAREALRTGRAAQAVIRTGSGRLLGLDGAPLSGAVPGEVALVLAPATPEQAMARFVVAAALTPRETDVLRAVVQGLSTRAMADQLCISEQTVQTHLRSIFAKTDLRSRRELLGRLTA